LRSTLDADGEIEHVGSTAVEGMDAKPIVDVLVLVDDLDEAEALTPRLEALGYERRRESDPVSGRVFFTKGAEDNRSHYLSVAERGGSATSSKSCSGTTSASTRPRPRSTGS
jgi:GrpB-like predicted nucleotidyltransferase (UPF0157 family)